MEEYKGVWWIIALVSVVLLFAFAIVFMHPTCKSYIIYDILQISQGGYGTPDKCILMTNKGKMTFTSHNCDKQIGEIVEVCETRVEGE